MTVFFALDMPTPGATYLVDDASLEYVDVPGACVRPAGMLHESAVADVLKYLYAPVPVPRAFAALRVL